jgi:hypothetical protein
LEVIGDFVFETCRRIDLPLDKLLLEAIASNLTQSLRTPIFKITTTIQYKYERFE